MKFKVAVIAILVAILGVTTTGTVLVVQEAREQTRIALKTAELVAIQADMEAYAQMAENAATDANSHQHNIGKNAWIRSEAIKQIQDELGIEHLYHEILYTYQATE